MKDKRMYIELIRIYPDDDGNIEQESIKGIKDIQPSNGGGLTIQYYDNEEKRNRIRYIPMDLRSEVYIKRVYMEG